MIGGIVRAAAFGFAGNGVVLLPKTAYRKTFFARQIADYCGEWKFRRLLFDLAPETAQRVHPQIASAYYIALINHIHSRMFPIHPAVFGGMRDEEYLREITYAGIPFELYGLDFYYDEIASPTLNLCYAINPNYEDEELPSPLDPYKAALERWLGPGKPLPVPYTSERWLPRGRTWREPWNVVAYAFAYVGCETGNIFLDLSDGYVSEMGDDSWMPEWNLEHLRWLEEEWKSARRILDGIKDLCKYVDAKPRERLPLLAGALCGDRQALDQVTVRK